MGVEKAETVADATIRMFLGNPKINLGEAAAGLCIVASVILAQLFIENGSEDAEKFSLALKEVADGLCKTDLSNHKH